MANSTLRYKYPTSILAFYQHSYHDKVLPKLGGNSLWPPQLRPLFPPDGASSCSLCLLSSPAIIYHRMPKACRTQLSRPARRTFEPQLNNRSRTISIVLKLLGSDIADRGHCYS